MIKSKIYRLDDPFKTKARAHQFAFKEEVLNDFYNEKNPQVILSPDSAKNGLIFCDIYRDFIRSRIDNKTFKTTALFSNMLRSEHIPYNIFTPMEEDLNGATTLFNHIIGGGINKITKIRIEFAGQVDKSNYLKDGTSFDTFIEYETTDGTPGGIGIEVKYTENSYRLGEKEGWDIKDISHPYHNITRESQYFIPDLDIHIFLKANNIRQIWRNHILGFAMLKRGDIKRFHHIHLYPKGNTHFDAHALPDYKILLTDKGKESFIDLTFESLFDMMNQTFSSSKQLEWIEYLQKRYIVK